MNRELVTGLAQLSAEKGLPKEVVSDIIARAIKRAYGDEEHIDVKVDVQTGAFKVFHFSIDITDVYELVDPTILILEYKSTGTVTTTGKAYANRYVGVYWFRDDKICRVREYFNPAITAECLAP